jgi:hypothetical protein
VRVELEDLAGRRLQARDPLHVHDRRDDADEHEVVFRLESLGRVDHRDQLVAPVDLHEVEAGQVA